MSRWIPFALLTLAACNNGSATTNNTTPEPQPSSGNTNAPDAAAERSSADASAPRATQTADPRTTALLAAWRASATPNSPQPTNAPRILFGPIAIDDPTDEGARVVAILGDATSAKLVYTAVPFVEGSQAVQPLGESDLGDMAPSSITGLAVRRITNDPRPDIAVFTNDERPVEGYIPLQMFAHLFTLRAEPDRERALTGLIRTQLELAGVRSEQELDAQLSTLGHFEVPTATTSAARFIARLRYATLDQFVSLVPAGGIRLCNDVPDRTGHRRKSCRSVARTAIRAEFEARFNIRRVLSPFAELENDDSYQLTIPACQRRNDQLVCNANIGGPAGVNWTLTTEGNALRVAEITAWHEDV